MLSIKEWISTLKPGNTRGDTIVEVMISMSILAIVLGATFATSSRSLRTGVASTQRNQALSIAQNQVEVIKNAYETNPVLLAALQNPASGVFCLDATTLSDTTLPIPSTVTTCTKYQGEDYAVRVNYDPARFVFNVDVNWSSATGTAPNSNVQLLYKLPGGF